MITGGDTLLGFMNQIKVREMEPIQEMASGTVLSRFKITDNMYQVISKSVRLWDRGPAGTAGGYDIV